RGGKLKYIRPSPTLPQDFSCALQTAEWVMTDLFVNRDVVPPDSIRSWKDLLKPEYKGKIASFDPRGAGPAQTTVPYLSRLFGLDYLRELYVGQEVALTGDNRQLAEWVVRGTYPIGIALVQASVEPLRTSSSSTARRRGRRYSRCSGGRRGSRLCQGVALSARRRHMATQDHRNRAILLPI